MAKEQPHKGSDLVRKRNAVVGQIHKDQARSRVKGGAAGGCSDPNVQPKRSAPVSKKNSPGFYGPGDGHGSPYR